MWNILKALTFNGKVYSHLIAFGLFLICMFNEYCLGYERNIPLLKFILIIAIIGTYQVIMYPYRINKND